MLSPGQTATLRAMVNRIIPPDDYPAGWEAGVGDYLMRQFRGDLTPYFATYQQGLAAIEAEAVSVYRCSFTELEAAQQDSLLTCIEQGQITTGWPVDPAAFFQLVVNHAMEGFYSDPANGGNHNTIAWQMIGFEVRG